MPMQPSTKQSQNLDHQIAIRIPDDLLARLDDHLSRMQQSLPSLRLTRSDAIRDLMDAALRASESAKSRAHLTSN